VLFPVLVFILVLSLILFTFCKEVWRELKHGDPKHDKH